jgi:hypothetical protein
MKTLKVTDRDNLEAVQRDWFPKELEIEKWIFEGSDEDQLVLPEDVFGERFLKIKRQVRTRDKKRADIIALDRRGNGVVIELKRDRGLLGVETQALQYLAAFSSLKGRGFVEHFAEENSVETILKAFKSLADEGVREEEINLRSRVVLIAQDFDPSLFSMGKWLGNSGVAFKCIQFTPFSVGQEKFISFSVSFEQSPFDFFPFEFRNWRREPGVYWHNIANSNQKWWDYLRTKNEIPAGFENQPGDEGERILKGYMKGDRIIAYAKGFGAVGWAKVENPVYRLIPEGDDEAKMGYHRHRLKISWQNCAKNLRDGISSKEFEKKTNAYHPIQTSSRIDAAEAEKLIQMLQQKFT